MESSVWIEFYFIYLASRKGGVFLCQMAFNKNLNLQL